MRAAASCLYQIALVLAVASWAVPQPTLHETTPHEHRYPNTEVLGDYHLRLVVDRNQGKLFLVFEDISEYPVRPVKNLGKIAGTAKLPDGSDKMLTFIPSEPLGHKFIHKFHEHARYAGLYVSQADWARTATNFKLTIVVPFHGREYELNYDYDAKSIAKP